jgi:hypothetical protein
MFIVRSCGQKLATVRTLTQIRSRCPASRSFSGIAPFLANAPIIGRSFQRGEQMFNL